MLTRRTNRSRLAAGAAVLVLQCVSAGLAARMVISEDTVWDVGGSPYYCLDGLLVYNDATLTIEANVVVVVGQNRSITLADQTPGTLLATGATFMGEGGQSWNGFRVGPLSTVTSIGTLTLTDCSVFGTANRAIYNYRGETELDGTTITLTGGTGIWTKADLTLVDATIQSNGSGTGLFVFPNSHAVAVTSSAFTNLEIGVDSWQDVEIASTSFATCGAAAIRITQGGLSLGEGNSFVNCPRHVELITPVTADITINGATGISNVWCPYGLEINSSADVSLKPPSTTTVYFAESSHCTIGPGSLVGENLRLRPEASGLWQGILVGNGAEAGSLDLSKSVIERSDDWAIDIQEGTAKLRQVSFDDPESEDVVRAASGTSVDVRLCDFDHISGPSGYGPGEGYRITGTMEYRPWIHGSFVVDSLNGEPLWSGFSDDPVNSITGNFTLDAQDIAINSRGGVMTFDRFYNSLDDTPGPLGPGWTHAYNTSLTDMTAETGWIKIRWHDGRADYYAPAGGAGYVPVSYGLFDTLEREPGTGEWTITKKDLTQYVFDSPGKLIAIIDKNGNATSLAYDGSDRLVSITDPPGRTLALTYYPDDLLESVSDWTGRSVSYEYTGGLLTRVTDLLGNDIVYAYTGNLLQSITDQRTVRTVYNTYDEFDRVTQQLDGRDYPTTFEYDTPNPRETTLTDALLGETVHRYDDDLRLIANIDPLGHSTASAFDTFGNCTMVADRNSNETSFQHDYRGNRTLEIAADLGQKRWFYEDARFPDLATKQIDPLGYVIEWTYDDNGNMLTERRWKDVEQTIYVERSWTYNQWGQVLSETDERNKTTTYVYDTTTPGRQGLLLSMTDAESNTTHYDYDNLWRRTTVVDARGTDINDTQYMTTYVYDDADRLVSEAGPPVAGFPSGITISYGYDEIGNRTSMTDGRGNTTTYVYDNNSNLIRVEETLDGNPQGRVTQYGYDELNRKTSMTDPEGRVWEYQYDAAGRMTKEIAPAPLLFETVYTHDNHGNVKTVTDPTNRVVTYDYDEMNRRIRTTDEAGNEWETEYDLAGRMSRSIDADDYPTDFAYDYDGRLIEVFDAEQGITTYYYDDAGNLTDILDASGRWQYRTYDDVNRLATKVDGNGGTWTYEYDAVGNLTTVLNPNGFATVRVYDAADRLVEIDYPHDPTVTYQYDGNGNLTGMIDGVGISGYTYDELNRLTSSTDGFEQTVGYSYDLVGNRTTLTYPDLKAVTYAYDEANRLDTITDWDVRVWDYTFDAAGRMLELVHPNGMTETRTYDLVGRLDTLSHDKSDSTPVLFYALDYDPQGNPMVCTVEGELEPTLEPSDVSYTYDDDHRLTSSTDGVTYGYDANGNMTSRQGASGTVTFDFDDADRLVGQSGGEAEVTHAYDGRGDRIARQEDSLATRYVLDHSRSMSHVLCETDPNGAVTAHYIHGPQIVGRIAFDGTSQSYHANWIGSVMALADDGESVTDQYSYTPYGVVLEVAGDTENPFQFIGALGVMVEEDNLHFMRARFYDPSLGRFLSKDPVEPVLASPNSLHRYVYAENKPLTASDPTGEFITLPYELVNLTVKHFRGQLDDDDVALFAIGTLGGFVPKVGPVISVGATVWGISKDWKEREGVPGLVRSAWDAWGAREGQRTWAARQTPDHWSRADGRFGSGRRYDAGGYRAPLGSWGSQRSRGMLSRRYGRYGSSAVFVRPRPRYEKVPIEEWLRHVKGR